jgi:hypothetical protein
MLDIRFFGVLLSSMWYTKQILICPCSYYGLVEMLDSSSPSALQSLGLFAGTGFFLVARFTGEPLPTFGTFVVAMDILSVGAVI